MKRFTFSLDKVLKLRSQETEQAKRALALALSALDQAQQRAMMAHQELADRTEEASIREQTGITAAEFGTLRSYLAFLQRAVAQAEQQVSMAEQVVGQRREALMAARQRERVLERLRERRLEQYTLEALVEEQKVLDELGASPGLKKAANNLDI
ncbi:MAG: hypothetical protein JWN15_3935 [Firmicutes bacterium]|nr:hypothetical protein [Bacillota bacterium]